MEENNFYKLSKKDKLEILEQVSEKQNLPLFAAEKDWWVTQTLALIFEMDMAKHLLFKGGTSLSKAWQLISRFSEDIDLALSREFLGFDSGLISKSQVKKIKAKIFRVCNYCFL
ncbi:nucleotidyl transferase AbiEii/AbiGii toxin family protein [Sulfurimonas sp. MAG313]|nr:nucleotidyl transferase AbiEii/AbiGii toxin family protein [Sulfurimonas sp. MAG313]MDF1881069.1 nucleotidyl transferase AbiEii/AbiGii toxin family protein [Sulfurimonas sp. MAG313]